MTPPSVPAYKRVLLKLSGEALMGSQSYGIDPAVATQIAKDVAEIQGMGVETAIVIGGALAKVSVIGKLSPSLSGCFRPMSMMW